MKTHSRAALIATFLVGVILGHVSAPRNAVAHGGQGGDEHVAHHLDEINDTLKKIERKIK